MKCTDIVLTSLNYIDRSQKRVCNVTILGNDGKQFSFEVIIPWEEIPKPAPQSMECFKKAILFQIRPLTNSFTKKILTWLFSKAYFQIRH